LVDELVEVSDDPKWSLSLLLKCEIGENIGKAPVSDSVRLKYKHRNFVAVYVGRLTILSDHEGERKD